MNDFPGKIDHDGADSPESRFIGGPIQENQEKTQLANPITHVSPTDPPMLLMHGDNDQLVPYDQSVRLHAALTKAKVETHLHRVKKGGHGFGGSDESREELFERVAEFFDRTLQ